MKYAEKLTMAREMHLNAGMRVGMQRMADLVAIALNDPAVMGKGVLGAGRLKNVFERVKELDDLFSEAFTTNTEADYKQEQLDRILKRIYGEKDFCGFAERYPNIRQVGYGGKRK